CPAGREAAPRADEFAGGRAPRPSRAAGRRAELHAAADDVRAGSVGEMEVGTPSWLRGVAAPRWVAAGFVGEGGERPRPVAGGRCREVGRAPAATAGAKPLRWRSPAVVPSATSRRARLPLRLRVGCDGEPDSIERALDGVHAENGHIAALAVVGLVPPGV